LGLEAIKGLLVGIAYSPGAAAVRHCSQSGRLLRECIQGERTAIRQAGCPGEFRIGKPSGRGPVPNSSFAGAGVLICQAQAASATLARCGTYYGRFVCWKRFRVEGCLVGWRRQRLPSRLPRWSRPIQQRHRLWAWSVGNHDGKDGAWVGECGAWVVVPRGPPGAQVVAA
jgi:hypothetical protein